MIRINKKKIYLNLSIIILLAAFFQIMRLTIPILSFKNANIFSKVTTYENVEIPDDFDKEEYLILYDSDESNSIIIKDNIKQTLLYIKKDFIEVDIKNYSDSYKRYSNIICTFEGMYKLEHTREIFDTIKDGGKLFLAERPILGNEYSDLYDSLGIKEEGGLTSALGVHLTSNLLIKGKDIEIGQNFIENSSLDVALKDEAKLLMESLDKKALLWSIKYGNGDIVFFNGTMLNEKTNRGIIVGALGSLNEDFMYPIINMKLMYIDDFPSPIPEGYNDTVYNEYKVTIDQFYRDIWWSTMIKNIEKYNLKYTGLIIESYGDDVSPPFEQPTDKDRRNFVLYGRELLKSGGEIGIHGYNHQSLAKEGYIKQNLGYKSWESEEDMKKAVEEVIKYGKNVFRDYDLRVYVPPSNILSPEGEKALLAGMKDLAIISAVYVDNFEKDAYDQEFEIREDGVLQMPRLTSGYEITEDILWSIYNGASSIGVFSHFIHPDDVLDDARTGGKTWTELSEEYEAILKEVKDKYFWLRGMTASQGGEETKRYLKSKPHINYSEEHIEGYCENFQENTYFVLKSDKNIMKKEGCEILKIDDGYYIVDVKKPHFIIKVR